VRPVAPRVVTPAPRPVGAPAPDLRRPGPGPGGPRPTFRPSTPRPPPTTEQVNALAKRERVPARIAKGELEGKMKCRIWKKLHAEEAQRFDQVYSLLEKHPELSLADGFGMLQSGMSITDFLARKERTQKKAAVKQARGSVDNTEIDAFIERLRTDATELSVVLGERTLLDVLVEVAPIAFQLQRAGRQEKLQVVALARRSTWEALQPGLPRDARLAQKPAPVARQPEKRPHSDPRPFLDHVGERVRLFLRNGMELTLLLRQVGRFDLLLGEDGAEVLVPLHALLRWEPAADQAPGFAEAPEG
jgi:sRNA-binding regulator protein Hfq